MLDRYTLCGHVGRMALRSKGWIRVAEIRKESIQDWFRFCPICRRSEEL